MDIRPVPGSLAEYADQLRAFADERDWQPFHTPKNLAMALAGEAGELLAEFQWLTPEESAQVMTDPAAGARVRAEMADVLSYLVRLADVLGIDLLAAAREKLVEVARRYPAPTDPAPSR
ncbi:nucleotide pyrophosphohydrolase [Micromonospora echinofusca]|uniref:Nucleotide pyrophosphohydrolase n=1 Tax=Micromonospora echinofusca TaxID=47858 RepID=A0ABS3VSX6_MICEH|nr:nucleotide pyrophosphohydrolase [Micromonospora echinofusca]MBO4207644.1 nucleotide pyrophosphohydrolase [Micromonospora echinofusca]